MARRFTADELRLRRAIIAAPDEDAPRLVLADYLQQRGEPQGTLIALQCAYPHAVGAERASIAKAVGELLRDLRALVGGDAAFCDQTSFDRGLISRVIMTPSRFRSAGAGLLQRDPVETLVVRGEAFDLRGLATAPTASLRHLELACRRGKELAPALAPLVDADFAELRSLRLVEMGRSHQDWERFARGLVAPALDGLHLDHVRLSPRLFPGMARNPSFHHLKALSLRSSSSLAGRYEETSAQLAALPLERLVSDHGHPPIEAWFDPGSRMRLVELELHGLVGSAALETIARSPHASQLRFLRLAGCRQATEAAVQALLSTASRLEHLGLPQLAPSLLTRALRALPPGHALRRVECDPANVEGYRELSRRFALVAWSSLQAAYERVVPPPPR